MKLFAKILLVILSIPVFLICLISVNIRFQFLNSNFWIDTFRKSGVYEALSLSISKDLAVKTIDSGAKITDIYPLTSFASASTIDTFVEKNIIGVTDYANGKTVKLKVYAPKINKVNDSVSVNSYFEEMSLEDFLTEYNVTNVRESDFKTISIFGKLSWALVITSVILFIAIVSLEYLLTNSGARLIAIGISMTFSGILSLVLYYFFSFVSKSFLENYNGNTSIGTVMVTSVFPPLIYNIVQIWLWIGVSVGIIGFLLFFIKKPAKNKLK